MARKYTNENAVKQHVRELLTKYGWLNWPNAAGPFSVGGIEDRGALRNGMYLAVECKFGTGKLTVLQEARGRSILAAGGFWWVVNEKNIGDFEAWLRDINDSEEV